MKYLYVIGKKDTAGPVKIGFSQNPEKRCNQLQTGHDEKLYVYYKVPVQEDLVLILEKIVHKLIGFHKKNGEWFNISVNEAKQEIDYVLIKYSENENLISLYNQKNLKFN